MNDIITKDFHGLKIRLIIIDGKEWIFEDVLPQIRKTGSYSIQPTQKPQTQLSEYQETLEYIDMFEKFSEKTKGKSHIELLKLDSFLTKSDKNLFWIF